MKKRIVENNTTTESREDSSPPSLPPVTQPIAQIREGSGLEIIIIIPLCLLLYFLGNIFLKKFPTRHEKIENIGRTQ